MGKSKETAGLLAIFLGSIGVHQFYLGNAGRGFIYLIGFIVFSSMGALWMTPIIALFDAVILFSINQSDFNKKYNPHLTPKTKSGLEVVRYINHPTIINRIFNREKSFTIVLRFKPATDKQVQKWIEGNEANDYVWYMDFINKHSRADVSRHTTRLMQDYNTLFPIISKKYIGEDRKTFLE